MRRILCYGDSNTWGYVPGSGERYDENTRWPALLRKALGPDFDVVEDGINGRTTSFDDPCREFRNGRRGLGHALLAAMPLDLLIVSLGINDLKYGDAAVSARGLKALLYTAVNAAAFSQNAAVFTGAPRILVLAPPPLGRMLDETQPDSQVRGQYGESLRFMETYRPVCEALGAELLDTALCAEVSDVDSVHLTADSHRRLAEAVTEKVRAMLEN